MERQKTVEGLVQDRREMSSRLQEYRSFYTFHVRIVDTEEWHRISERGRGATYRISAMAGLSI